MVDVKLLIKVEEKINSRIAKKNKIKSNTSISNDYQVLFQEHVKELYPKTLKTNIVYPGIKEDILNSISMRRKSNQAKSETVYEYVTGYIKNNSDQFQEFIKNNGKINEVKLYTYARIDNSTWSRLRLNTPTPSGVTMRKLIFALKLDENKANEMMRLGGDFLNDDVRRDEVILAILDNKIYEIEIVKEILEWQSNGNPPFKNIY